MMKMLATNIAGGLLSKETIEIWVLLIGDRAINQEHRLEGQRAALYFSLDNLMMMFSKDFNSLL
jgi:hypothetical protein